MRAIMSNGGSASSATPKSHDLLFNVQGWGSYLQLLSLIVEQAVWRFLLPVLTLLATCISVYLAWVFGSGFTGHVVMSKLLGSGFALFVVASRIFALLLDDEKAKPKAERESLWGLRAAFYGCVLLSIITAADVIGDMQQDREDRRGAGMSMALSAKRGATAAADYQTKANTALRKATDAVQTAQRSLDVAIADLDTHRLSMAVKYPYKTLREGTEARKKMHDNYGWSVLTTMAGAGGYPYQQAINAAQRTLADAREAEARADEAARTATKEVIAAEREYRLAREGTAPVRTVNPNSWLTPEQKIAVWSYFWAVMLDVICFVGIGPSRRLLKGLTADRNEARAIIDKATKKTKNDRADGGSRDGAEDPAEPPKVPPPVVPGQWSKRLEEAYAAIHADASKARALRMHRHKIEAVVTAVLDENNPIASVSYSAIRGSKFKMPNSGIKVLHEILISANLAVKGAGNEVLLT